MNNKIEDTLEEHSFDEFQKWFDSLNKKNMQSDIIWNFFQRYYILPLKYNQNQGHSEIAKLKVVSKENCASLMISQADHKFQMTDLEYSFTRKKLEHLCGELIEICRQQLIPIKNLS